jgi:hypothetical protein
MDYPLFVIRPEGMNIFTLRLLLAATLPVTNPHHVCNEDCPCHVNHRSPGPDSNLPH